MTTSIAWQQAQEAEFSLSNPPGDIQPLQQYYELRDLGWWCKSCWKYCDLKHSKTDSHKNKIAWAKDAQAAERMGYLSATTSSSRIGCQLQLPPPSPPPSPSLPAPPPAPPLTSGQNEAVRADQEAVRADREAVRADREAVSAAATQKQSELIEKQSELIKEQSELIKKQSELMEEQTQQLAEITDKLNKMATDFAELKSWWWW